MPNSSAKIGYLILAHDNCEQVARMIRILNHGNSRIVLHLDGAVKGEQREHFFSRVRKEGEAEEAKAVTCHWGDWSLVEATLSGLELFRAGGDPVSHVVLLSGTHFPIRSPLELENFLTEYADTDFIEAVDAKKVNWAKGGMNLERFQYFFPLNGRKHRRGFTFLTSLQKKLGVKRSLPKRLKPRLGSQWWCLRFSTCVQVLEFLKQHPKVKRYFKSTWIPDESFFQTLVANLNNGEEVAHVPFVLHALTPIGRPYVFHNDHEPFLTGARHHFFIRKISPQAETLFQALEDKLARIDSERRPITIPASLAKENAELDTKVESYYPFREPLPGHLHDNYREQFLAIEQPVFVILGKSFSEDRVKGIAKSLSSIPNLLFMGRLFRKGVVEFPGAMEELGLGKKSFEIRDRHTCQLFHEFFSRRQCGIVILVDPDLDFESWQSFVNLQNYLPICVSDLDEPRFKQLAFVERVRNSSWGSRAKEMRDGEIAPYIGYLCSKGLLTGSESGEVDENSLSPSDIREESGLRPLTLPHENGEKFPIDGKRVERNIFFLWDSGLENAPHVVQKAYHMWEVLNPEWKIHFFDKKSLNEVIADWPKSLHKAAIQAKANALRIEMLNRYGGVWVDATLIPTKPLDQWIDSATEKSGFFAFRLAQPCERRLDNWFLASAQPGNPIVNRWRNTCMEFWEREWLMCRMNSEVQKTYRKPSIGIIPEPELSGPVEYPYYWMHYLFNRLYLEDDLVRELWDKTPSWLARNCLLPSRLFRRGDYEAGSESFLKNDAPVKKMDYRLDWPEKLIDERTDAISLSHASASQPDDRFGSADSGMAKCDFVGKGKNCFVILTCPRSGSYLLVDLLNRIKGVQCHGEIFKKETIELEEGFRKLCSWGVEKRDQQPLRYLSKFFDLGGSGAVGFKLFSGHNEAVENHVNTSEGIAKIILRRNVFDTFISLQRAKTSGIWIDKGDQPHPKNTAFRFEPDDFERHCEWHQNYFKKLERLSNEQPDQYLVIDYEEVVDRTAFERICPFIGVPVPPSKLLVSVMKKQTIEEIEDLVINFEEMAEYLRERHAEVYSTLNSRLKMH